MVDHINFSREEMLDHSERQMISHLFTQLPSLFSSAIDATGVSELRFHPQELG
jgi:hypothetical protein